MGSVTSCNRAEPECLATETAYDVLRSVNEVHRSKGEAVLAGGDAQAFFEQCRNAAIELTRSGKLGATTSLRRSAKILAEDLDIAGFQYVKRGVTSNPDRYFEYTHYWNRFVDGPLTCVIKKGTVKSNVNESCPSGQVVYLLAGDIDSPENYRCIEESKTQSPVLSIDDWSACQRYPR